MRKSVLPPELQGGVDGDMFSPEHFAVPAKKRDMPLKSVLNMEVPVNEQVQRNSAKKQEENRAKLYEFQDDHWREKGTGNVVCHIPQLGKPAIIMYDDSQSDTAVSTPCHALLLSQLPTDGSIGREGDSIFMWREDVHHYALSFQHKKGWRKLLKAIQSLKPGYHLENDGKLMVTTEDGKVNEWYDDYEDEDAESNMGAILPWHSHHLSPHHASMWKYRMEKLSKEKRKNMGSPSTRPRNLISQSDVDRSPSQIEPLFEAWFISQVISFLDLLSIAELGTALSSRVLRNRWLEALPLIKCPSSVDTFDMHNMKSIQWLISRRLKISRLALKPWHICCSGYSNADYDGQGRIIFRGLNFWDHLQTLQISANGVIEGLSWTYNAEPLNLCESGGDEDEFGDSDALRFLSACKHLVSLTLEFGVRQGSWLKASTLEALLSGCHQLKKLKVKYFGQMTDESLEILSRDCPLLEDIHFALTDSDSGIPGLSMKSVANLVAQRRLTLKRLILEVSPFSGRSSTLLANLAQCTFLEELYLSLDEDNSLLLVDHVQTLLDNCKHLKKLGFSGCLFDEPEAIFAVIGCSTTITSLKFVECDGCTDNALAALASDGRLQLKEIVIRANDDYETISDAGVKTLATRFAASLESVKLMDCMKNTTYLDTDEDEDEDVVVITDDGLAAFANCPHLRCIEVDGANGAFLEPLTMNCRGLEKIIITICPRGGYGATDELDINFQAIADRCPLLREVELGGVTDKDVVCLVRGCPLLTRVRLSGKKNATPLSDVSLGAIAAGLPLLERLSLFSLDRRGLGFVIMTQTGLRILLEHCPRITFLNTNVKINDPVLRRTILQRRIIAVGLHDAYHVLAPRFAIFATPTPLDYDDDDDEYDCR